MRQIARLSLPAVTLMLAASACKTADCPPAASATASATATTGHSIDLAAMDRSMKPGTDFFLYANGAWYKKTEIPADRQGTGLFLRIGEVVEERQKALLEEASHAKDGAETKKIGDYYATYLDEAEIEKRGTAPLTEGLQAIAKIADKRGLASALGAQVRADVDPLNSGALHTAHLFGLWVEQDLNDPSRNTAYLLQGGLGMPDRSFYLDESAEKATLRAQYERHIAAILKLAGVADAAAKAARVVALEKKIATVHASRVDSEDVGKANHPWSRQEFGSRAPGLDWEAFFKAASLDKQNGFIAWHPQAFAGLAGLVKNESLDTWKDYLTARYIDDFAQVLPRAFVEEDFAFYAKTLRGVPMLAPRARRALEMTNAVMGEAVGKAYVGRHFPPESKHAIEDMVKNITAAFDHRIDNLKWMAPATKAKAKQKLSTLYVGVGYPDKFRDDSGLKVVRGDAFGNLQRAKEFEYRVSLAKLGHPADRAEWAMTPQEVNAVNLPVRNALNFPAAILVPPFFDPQAPSAANYGAIGSVIGHEISHSFDDQGAKFDDRGRFANWWTAEDLAHFEASGEALATQFSAYRPFPDAAVDGKLTLSENIADLAGLAAAYDAWRASLGGAPAPVQEGLSGDQQFFLSYAQCWQTKVRDDALRLGLTTNGHAPPHYRVLTVRNLDPWYSAFSVDPSDALYLASDRRVRVW